MSEANQQALFEYALRLGDDSLTLGHRLSECCSNGPFLEEDIALINISLDMIGRARMFLSYAGEIEDNGRDEDQLAYHRDCRDYRNLLICELPRGDFGFTIARQFLLDAHYLPYFEALSGSADTTLAGIAAKAAKESRYHLRHTSQWMIRLGDGTEESHQRVQDSLEQLWGYTPELFNMDEIDQGLLESGIGVDLAPIQAQWSETVNAVLAEATLKRPEDSWQVDGGRRGMHTEHLGHLLSDLQYVQRAYPGNQW
jgi:ring-1,2-phenylacetyl-CoA epoxidase subunit PaaC